MLRCECPDDDEYRVYTPLYVEAYMINRECAEQTIEDWTDAEGLLLFAAGEIYREVEVPVAITGTEANAFSVDMTRPEWRKQFQEAVTAAVMSAGLAKTGDKVELRNMRHEPLGDQVDRLDLEQVGMIYATVNGQRTMDTVKSKQAGLGCAVRTPLTHSPIKEDVLHSCVKDMVGRAKELIISALIPSVDMTDLNVRATGGGNKSAASGPDKVVDIKRQVADMIYRDAGLCTAELGTFKGLIDTYADPLVLTAIRLGKLTHRDVADKMAAHIAAEVVAQIRADNKDVEGFYQAQQLTKTGVQNHIGSIFSSDSTMGQTAARLGKIRASFPTPAKLYRTVVSNALDANEGLCNCITDTLRNAIPPNQRQRLTDHFETLQATQPTQQQQQQQAPISAHVGRSGEYGYDHGHHEGHHRSHHHGGGGDRQHVPHSHGPDGHHTGPHRHHHHQDREWEEDGGGYGEREAPGYRHRERATMPYPRHEMHLTAEQATQAQIRAYVASGFVPPRFETFAEMEAREVKREPAPLAAAKKEAAAPVATAKKAPATAPIVAKMAPSKSSPNVTREAPSLEPPVQVKVVGDSAGKNTFPVDDTNRRLAAAAAVFAKAPPALEKAVPAPAKKPIGYGLSAKELPSSEPIPVAATAQRRTAAPKVVPVAASLWNNEMPSAEVIAAPVVAPVVAHGRSKPPPLQYAKSSKTSPSFMPTPAPAPKQQQQEASSLPSLAKMLQSAKDSERVH